MSLINFKLFLILLLRNYYVVTWIVGLVLTLLVSNILIIFSFNPFLPFGLIQCCCKQVHAVLLRHSGGAAQELCLRQYLWLLAPRSNNQDQRQLRSQPFKP